MPRCSTSKFSNPKSFFSNESAALAAAFFDQADFADGHFAVDGFAHIVDGEPGDRDRRHRFHLNAGLAADPNGRFDVDAGGLMPWREFDFHRSDIERVAHANEFGSFLGRHNAGDARDGKDIALFDFLFANQSQCFWLHADGAAGDGDAAGDFLLAHVDHARPPLFIQVTQLCHIHGFFLPRKNYVTDFGWIRKVTSVSLFSVPAPPVSRRLFTPRAPTFNPWSSK